MNVWNVISGGPCSGKTTTIQALSFLGYRTMPEVARLYLDQKKSQNCSIKTIRQNTSLLQNEILQNQIEMESRIKTSDPVFLDRSIIDTIAYNSLFSPENILDFKNIDLKQRYSRVFLLNLLPDYEMDYARFETKSDQLKIHASLRTHYSNLGYRVIEIPVLPVFERAEFILNSLNK